MDSFKGIKSIYKKAAVLAISALVAFSMMPLTAGMSYAESGIATKASASSSGSLTIDQAQTVFLTDAGATQYYEFDVQSDGYYTFNANGTAGDISLVFANASGTIKDIADSVKSYSSGGTTYYVTTSAQKLTAGKWYVGLSAPRVSKATLTVNKMPALTENQTQSTNVEQADLLKGYTFTPATTGRYEFYEADSRGSGASISIYDSTGEEISSTSTYTYLQDWYKCCRYKAVTLTAGATYYVLVKGDQFASSETIEMTVTPLINKDAPVINAGTTTKATIDSYSFPKCYRITPESSGTYFLQTSSNKAMSNFTVYDENENVIEKASIKKYEKDSYDDTVYVRQLALKLTKGKTYYITARFNGYRKGTFTLKYRQLPDVSSISIIHKPTMKKYIYQLDTSYAADGAVLNIHYKDGTTSKWEFADNDKYVQGFAVTMNTSSKTGKRTLTFKYRGKSASCTIPVVKVNKVYKGAALVGNNSTVSANSNEYRFRRYIPTKSGLYGITGTSSKSSYRVVVFNRNGVRVASKTLGYSYANKKYSGTEAVPMSAGKTYYIGVRYNYSERGSVNIDVHYDVPKTPTNVKVTKTSKHVAEISWTRKSKSYKYQIAYKTVSASKYKKALTSYAHGNEIDKLKSGRTYVFKVRAYRVVQGKRYYGSYSNTVTVRM